MNNPIVWDDVSVGLTLFLVSFLIVVAATGIVLQHHQKLTTRSSDTSVAFRNGLMYVRAATLIGCASGAVMHLFLFSLLASVLGGVVVLLLTYLLLLYKGS